MSNQPTLHHEENEPHFGNNNNNNNHHHHHHAYNHLTSVAENLHVADQTRANTANHLFHSSLQKFYEGYKVASHDTERFTALNRSFSDSYNLAKEQLLSPSHFNSSYHSYKQDRKEEAYKPDIEDRSIDLSEKPYGKSDEHDAVDKREKDDDVAQGIPIPSFYDNFKLSKDEENAKIGNACDFSKEEEYNKNSSVLNNSLNDSYRSDENSSPDSPSNLRGGQFANSLDRSSHEFSRSFSFHNSAGGNQPTSPYQEGGYPSRRYSLPTPPLSEYFRSPASSTSPTASSVSLLHASNIHPNSAGIYFCHLCSYSGKCKDLFDEHMSIHFEYSCPHCDYTSRTEGRLKRHIKDFHTNEDPNNPNKVQRTMPGRPKVYRCKQCDFSTITKVDFWQHARSHIKEEKLLQCPRCPFVTEYKHHLEYHLRNHFGSKPFKCTKCNYSCVNKSMLNSHMKSHTNVYQYRCADCTYATKYCHSLKLHLRKYNHKPAAILNNDGSLPQGLDIESAGLSLLAKRGPPRGPRGPRKDKNDHFGHLGPLFNFPMSSMAGMNPGMNGGLMSPYWPLVNHIPNGIHPPPPLIPASKIGVMGPTPLHSLMSSPSKMNMVKADGEMLRCNLCAFTADNPDIMNGHVVKVHAHAENQDLFSMFGISSEALLDEHTNKSRQTQMQKPSQPPADYPSHLGDKGMLHVQTESQLDASKSSPHSWPRNGGLDPVGQRMQQMMSYSTDSHSLPELYNRVSVPKQEPVSQEEDGTDILKQMTLKFGGAMSPQPVPRKETPLDLTKPKSVSPELPSSQFQLLPSYLKRPLPEEEMRPMENSAVHSQDTAEASPRKRSRKGKAYKLDTLCLKLQEKQSNSPYESESEESIETMPTEMRGEGEDLTNNVCQTPSSPLEDLSMTNGMNNANNVNDPNDVNNVNNVSDGNCESNDKACKSDSDSEGNLKADLEQIHNNIQFLNSQLKHDSEAKREDYAMDKSEGDAVDCRSSPNDDLAKPDPQDDAGDQTSEIVHSVFTNRRKPMTPALRRGTELAWKILNDPSIPMGNPTQNSEIVLETPPRNGLTQQRTNGSSNPPHPLSGLPNGISQIKPKGFHGSEHYECPYCDIAFRNCVMYTMHMGYHGYQDPYKCNMCGHCAKDKVDFFLHIARAAHS